MDFLSALMTTFEETVAEYPMMAPCVKVAHSYLRRKLILLPNHEAVEIGFPFAFATSPGGNYDQVSLPTLKKGGRALGTEIEIKVSAWKIDVWLRKLIRRSLTPAPSALSQILLFDSRIPFVLFYAQITLIGYSGGRLRSGSTVPTISTR